MRSRNEILSFIFRQGGTGYFESGDTLVEAGELPRYVYQLRTGLAYQSCWFADERRAIVDIFAPGNVVGLEMILSLRVSGTVTAAGPVKCFAVEAESFYRLMENREIALCITSLLVEARRRSEELAARIARLESTRPAALMKSAIWSGCSRKTHRFISGMTCGRFQLASSIAARTPAGAITSSTPSSR